MYLGAIGQSLAVHLAYRIESIALLAEPYENIIPLRWTVTVPNVTEFSELDSDVILRHCRREADNADRCVGWILVSRERLKSADRLVML